MKIGILITARLGSTRLERKHLLPVNGKPLLQYLIERIRREFDEEIGKSVVKIIITTSDEEENRTFEQFSGAGVSVFYGSVNNIPLRHYQTAVAHNLDAMVSVDGDDILCSPAGMRRVYEELGSGDQYVQTSDLPFGMNSSGYSTPFLARSIRDHQNDTLETGWGRIFGESVVKKISMQFPVSSEKLRFTLDYEEDYRFFKAVIMKFGEGITGKSDEDLAKIVLKEEIFRFNEEISRKYWENFHRVRDREISESQAGRNRDYKVHEMKSEGQKLWSKAKSIIPGGNQLLSKRSERFLPGLWPAYYSKAKGCEVWDIEGNHYYDFAQMGVGSCILGYADAEVDREVVKAIQNGSMCTLNCPEEVELAERLTALHPWAEMARFARTGGEACAIAVRIARAATGKSKVAFCGYHGWHDWYLAANLGDSTNLDSQLLPGLACVGVPRELRETSIPFNYNKLNELEEIAAKYPNEIGTIIMEPERGTSPDPGFLEGVKDVAARIGAVLIFDEVTSGFRMNMGGIHLVRGVQPDIAVFGKALGNGYPIAAIIGRRAVMQCAQDTFISSTFWTERMGFAAALACLKKMEECKAQNELIRYGNLINDSWTRSARKHDIGIHISGIPPLTHISFNTDDPLAVQTLYTQEMLKRGFLLGSAVYTTYSYSDEVIERFAEATDAVFKMIGQALKDNRVKLLLEGAVIHAGFKRLT